MKITLKHENEVVETIKEIEEHIKQLKRLLYKLPWDIEINLDATEPDDADPAEDD